LLFYQKEEMNASPSYSKSTPVFLAFFCMGFADVVGPLVGLVKDTFYLSNFLAQMITMSGLIMFGVLSIPLGIYQDKKGKKHVLLVGLAIAFFGLLIPIANGMYGPTVEIIEGDQGKFYIVLLSILLLGAGSTFLQVSGNPIMRDVSPEGKYSSNLSLGQSIKAIGSSIGFLLPPAVIAFAMDWSLLFPLYAIMILITWIWIKSTPIVEKTGEGSAPASFRSCIQLLGNRYVLMMVMAIFLYVGAEISMSSGIPILLKEVYGIEGFTLWVTWALFFLPILVGRFVGSAILRKIRPGIFLVYTVLLSIAGIILLFTSIQAVALLGIFFIGLGFANIFPLVFSITVDRMPSRGNELSGLMISAIVGGAIIPPIMGAVADATSVLLGFIVPSLCVLYIGVVSFRSNKQTA
jgi:fucose permease